MNAIGATCARVGCSFSPLVEVDNDTSTRQRPFCSALCDMFVGSAWLVSRMEWTPAVEASSERLLRIGELLGLRQDPSDWPVELDGSR